MMNFKGSTRSRQALEMRSSCRRRRPAIARDAVRRDSVFKNFLQSSRCVHVDTVQGSVLARKPFRTTTVVDLRLTAAVNLGDVDQASCDSSGVFKVGHKAALF